MKNKKKSTRHEKKRERWGGRIEARDRWRGRVRERERGRGGGEEE